MTESRKEEPQGPIQRESVEERAHRLSAWEHKVPATPIDKIEPDEIKPPSAIKSLELIKHNEDDGVIASKKGEYDNVFGRDSALIGLSIVEKQPDLAINIIKSLARRQGTKNNPATEEAPGKIHHEDREKHEKETLIDRGLTKILGETSYYSADSTPLYIKLVFEYCKYHGDEILAEEVNQLSGEKTTIGESVAAATEWIVSNINEDGLVEVERPSKTWIISPFRQTWKDSYTGVMRPDGSLANTEGRIILPELQTLSIDALEAQSKLLEESDKPRSIRLKELASTIRLNTLKTMWSEQDGFFISALEEDSNGNMVPVKTLESTAGRMLNSTLFDKLDDKRREEYITLIVKKLFSDDFLTDVGIRSRALRYAKLINNADYSGSYESYPADTLEIIKGLKRQGLNRLAEQLENRIINAINMAGNNLEFFFVDEKGIPSLKEGNGGTGTIAAPKVPQEIQGWTISADLYSKRDVGKRKTAGSDTPVDSWQARLEEKILSEVKEIPLYKTRKELADHFPLENSDTKYDQVSGGFRALGHYFGERIKQKFKKTNN